MEAAATMVAAEEAAGAPEEEGLQKVAITMKITIKTIIKTTIKTIKIMSCQESD